jgi:hypothetical protein
MRRAYGSALVAAICLLTPAVSAAQQGEANRTLTDGGIAVPGWQGKADGDGKVTESRLTKDGDALRVVTGPAITYWNPANTASGDYTVSATFTEPEYMNINDHPHPYGIMIAGNALGTPRQSYLYCAAYGNGRFIVRGFGPEPFQVNGRRPEAHAAVRTAAGKGQPVTQEIAVSVKGDKVECAINGTVVGSYDKTAVVGEGKLTSTDGVYGIRFAHNTDAVVKGLTVTRH